MRRSNASAGSSRSEWRDGSPASRGPQREREFDDEVAARLISANSDRLGACRRLCGEGSDELKVVHNVRSGLGRSCRTRIDGDLDVPRAQRMLVEPYTDDQSATPAELRNGSSSEPRPRVIRRALAGHSPPRARRQPWLGLPSRSTSPTPQGRSHRALPSPRRCHRVTAA
jgi:hypothetical protein